MKFHKTGRGFYRYEFADRNDEKCSLQESSLADERAIWLGIDKVVIKAFKPGRGWWDVPMPEINESNNECLLDSARMHLTQNMVRELLPALEHFATTGELPEGEEHDWRTTRRRRK